MQHRELTVGVAKTVGVEERIVVKDHPEESNALFQNGDLLGEGITVARNVGHAGEIVKMPPDVVGKQNEVLLCLGERDVPRQHGRLDDLLGEGKAVELLGDLQGLHVIPQLMGVDVAKGLFGLITQSIVGAIVQNVAAEGYRLGECGTNGGLSPLALTRLRDAVGINGENACGVQLQGVIRGDLGHAASQKLQSIGHAVKIQKMLGLLADGAHACLALGVVVAEELVNGDAEIVGQEGECVHVGIANARLPTGNGLRGHAKVCGQGVLRYVVLLSQKADLLANLDLVVHLPTSEDV